MFRAFSMLKYLKYIHQIYTLNYEFAKLRMFVNIANTYFVS